MEPTRYLAIGIAVGVAILCAMLPALDLTGKGRVAERERRMAAHRMNARLLRFNI